MKIFIASSGRSALLAEALESELTTAAKRANINLEVVAWFRDGFFPPGEDTLTSLMTHCGGSQNIRPSDFCAVLLTKDDEVSKKGNRNEAPRDNCIFELGLFIGALGLDPKRCFMVSSVGEQSLPSDLKGRTLINFDEPLDVRDPEQCADAMREVAARIRNRLLTCGRYTVPELKPTSLDDLMKFETRREKDGALSDSSQVMVGVEQSFTAECKWASRVVQNLKAGIKYTYFVGNIDSSNDIARFAYALAVAGSSETRLISEPDKNLVLENLKLLQNGLSINLSPCQVPFAFRIHDSSDSDRVICYLRQPGSGKYFEWAHGRVADDLARGLQSIAIHDYDLDVIYVIRPTRFLDFQFPQNALYLQHIRRAVISAFRPELRQYVERVCFGTEPKSQAVTAP